MSLPISRYYFTVAEFERMGQAGILTKDARLELIEGEIIEMSPVGSRHAACVNFLSRFLNRAVGDIALVSAQNPIRLSDFSEPQPDVALLRLRDDFYRAAHPTPAETLLIIEVADTTLEYDRQVKALREGRRRGSMARQSPGRADRDIRRIDGRRISNRHTLPARRGSTCPHHRQSSRQRH